MTDIYTTAQEALIKLKKEIEQQDQLAFKQLLWVWVPKPNTTQQSWQKTDEHTTQS